MAVENWPSAVYTHAHASEHASTHAHACTHARAHTHTHARMRTHTHTHTHTMCAHTHKQTHIHTHTHTHTHTHISTQLRKWFRTDTLERCQDMNQTIPKETKSFSICDKILSQKMSHLFPPKINMHKENRAACRQH